MRRHRVKKHLRVAVLLACTCVALAACDSEPGPPEQDNPFYGDDLPAVILPERGVNGRMVTAVDDLGNPPISLPGGWIVIIPADKAPKWDELPAEWSQTRLDTAGAEFAEVNDQARFHLTPEPGPHFICDTWQHPETGTYRLDEYNCWEINLPDHGTITAYSGDGMFGAFVDDPSRYTN
ncbi:hypothetical protein SAMN06309944_0761 [Micrococcales bacterium KH10]|nr:hypothetical protein SAMN06309944_0761 [Micrococcales bacterium KH10]